MASQLRQILDYFQHQHQPQSLHTVAHEMAMTPQILGEMIDYWVRKGKIRIVAGNGHECTSCGVRGACPFVMQVPRYYEVVSDDDITAQQAHISDTCQVNTVCDCEGGCRCTSPPMPTSLTR